MPVLEALGHAVPGPPVLQADVRRKAEEVLAVLAPELLEKLDIFEHTGIRARYLSRPLDWFLESRGWAERAAVYHEVGGALLEQATREALAAANVRAEDVDGVVLVSSTGLATPSLDAALADRVGLRPDIVRVPVWGLGCVGGVAGFNVAADLARAHPEKRFLLLSLELCSLAFNLSDMSVRAFVANTLFADGCAAVLVRGDACPGTARIASVGPGAWHTWPDSQRVMGWDVTDEGLRVVFSRKIPEITRNELAPVVERYLKAQGGAPDRYVFHPGGTKVLEAYDAALGLRPDALDSARVALREYGNMSSPTVFFALRESLRGGALRPGETALLAALGPGFTAGLSWLEG